MYIWNPQKQRLRPKKKQRETTRKLTTGLFMLRCKELGFSVEELEQIDFGVVVDMMTEQGNDQYKYPYKATQKDFDNF